MLCQTDDLFLSAHTRQPYHWHTCIHTHTQTRKICKDTHTQVLPALEGARLPLAAPARARLTVGSRNITLQKAKCRQYISWPSRFKVQSFIAISKKNSDSSSGTGISCLLNKLILTTKVCCSLNHHSRLLVNWSSACFTSTNRSRSMQKAESVSNWWKVIIASEMKFFLRVCQESNIYSDALKIKYNMVSR